MRIRRAIIPILLALAAAGSILAGSAAHAAASPARGGTHAVVKADVKPNFYYYD